jgi:hypothetical protein
LIRFEIPSFRTDVREDSYNDGVTKSTILALAHTPAAVSEI